MANVFISYSRKDKEFVRRMHEALHKQGRDIWVDWEDIPVTATWWDEICQGIEGADSFLFVISPDSVSSKVCNQELDYALQHHKRLIPVVYREAETPLMNPALIRHNWLYMREADNFDTEFQRLIKAMDTDLEYVHDHTRLLVRAKEWDQNGHNTSFVLRGTDLKEAETWLAESGSKEPKPTELQIRYIVASRGAASRSQRVILAAVSVAFLIAIGLSIFALTQRNLAFDAQATAIAERDRANLEAGRAVSRQIALIVRNVLEFRVVDLALLLSVEANRASETTEALGSLRDSLNANPHLLLTLADYDNVRFSADGKLLQAQKADGTTSYWNTVTGKPVEAPATFESAPQPTPTSTPDPLQIPDSSVTVTSPNGRSKAAVRNNTLTITDSTDEPVNTLLENRDGLDQATLIYSPDSNKLAVSFCADAVGGFGCFDHQLHLFSVLTGEILGTPLERLRDQPTSITFTPASDKLAVGYQDGQLIIYDGNTLRSLAEQKVGDEIQPVTALTFSADGSLLAGFGGDVFIVDVQQSTLPILERISTYSPYNGRLMFSADNKALLGDYGNSYVKEGIKQLHHLWSVDNVQRPDSILAVPEAWYYSLAFTPDGATLALGGNGNVVLWDMKTDSEIATVNIGQEREIIRLAYSPDAKWLAVGTADNAVSLWDASTLTSDAPAGKTLTENVLKPDIDPTSDSLNALRFSADSRTLFASTAMGTIVRWDTAMGTQLGRVELEQAGSGLFLLNGKMLRHTADIHQVGTNSPVHDAETGATIALTLPWVQFTRSRYTPLPLYVDFTGDGQWVIRADCESGSTSNVIMCYGGVVEIFQNQTAITPIRELHGGADTMLAAAISPDQQLVIGTNQDGKVYVWQLYLQTPLERACSVANRNLTSTEWALYLPDQEPHETCPGK